MVVQRNAMKVWDDIQQAVDGPSFRENLEHDGECPLDKEQLDGIFDPTAFLGHKDVIFTKLKELEF